MWLVSPAFDLAFFAAPALVSAGLALAVPSIRENGAATPVWAWVVLVLLVDVSHVYASLYRTYFDRQELGRRPILYGVTPFACLFGGMALYRFGGELLFWRTLAYMAVFHFVRQQYGLLALYDRRDPTIGPFDRKLDEATIYAATCGPLLYWHTHLPRGFVWFVPGDFIRLPSGLLWNVAAPLLAALYAAFFLRQLQLWLRDARVFAGRIAIVGSTLAAWWTGIVLLDSDIAFTLTNTVAHGVPYFALVWLALNRRFSETPGRGFLAQVSRPAALPIFLGVLFGLAYFEEGLWDAFVWQEHESVFGTRGVLSGQSSAWLWMAVPLLAVPQATHYILDAFIWKMDGSNPGLRRWLIGDTR